MQKRPSATHSHAQREKTKIKKNTASRAAGYENDVCVYSILYDTLEREHSRRNTLVVSTIRP